MAIFSHFLRDMHQILFPNAEQHAIPSLDGALSPNEALDHCRPIGDPLPGADDIAEAIYWAAAQPPHVNVNRIELMATAQSFAPFQVTREG